MYLSKTNDVIKFNDAIYGNVIQIENHLKHLRNVNIFVYVTPRNNSECFHDA